MTTDKIADNILLPELYQKKKRRRKKLKKRGGLMRSMIMVILVILVSGALFSFADIGGNIALSIAKSHLSKNFGIELTAESITGNPIRGYTIRDFSLTDKITSSDIFSAGFLSARVNLPAMLTGNLRLAEISLGGISMDVDQFIASIKSLELPPISSEPAVSFMASPAFADEEVETLPNIPLDRFSIVDSRFSSRLGVFDVHEIGADVPNLNVDVDGAINGLPLRGKINMDSFTMMNRSELYLGAGMIIATGGLNNGKLDIHLSAEDFELSELTSLYPAILNSGDFEGKADFTADIMGTADNPRISGSVDYLGTKIYGYPVERASANLLYAGNRISVTNIQASAFNVPLQGEIAAAFRPNQPVSVMLKLDGSEAYLDGLDKILGIPELKALSGKVGLFNVNISGPVDALSGLVNFSAPRIVYDGRALTDIRAQMKLSRSDTANVDGKFTFEDASGYLSGNVASILTTPRMNLTAKIADLDIKRIESMIPDAPQYKLDGKITASVTVKGTASNPSVEGEINSPEFSGWGQKITKPAVNFSFSEKTLTLRKTEGTLNGMPISVTGKISEIPSPNPKLDINATMTMTTSALKAYVPDIESYDLKGTINAGLKIGGDMDNPSVNLIATSPNLQAMDMITAKDLELTTAMDVDLSNIEKSERITVNVSAKSITAGGVTFTGANANVSKNGDSIILGGLNARSGEGTIMGAGTASVSGKSPLDFSFKFTDLDLAALAASSGVDVKGKMSGTLKIAGQNANPAMTLTANVPSLNASGFSLSKVFADVSGNMSSIALKNVRAEVEGSEITASGNVQVMPAVKVNVTLNGKSINLAQLLREYPAMKGNISGLAGFTFTFTGNDKSISGNGTLTAPSLTAFGLKLSDVNLPLAYSGNDFSSKGGTAKLYGGNAKNTFTFNIDTMKFTDDIEANSVDVNGLIQDVSGGLEGKISGTGKLTFRVTGSAKDKVSYSGNGNFSMGQGAITGFKWLDIFTKIHKSDGLRYSSVNAPLTLQTGKLLVKSGAIANAVKNDALYRYAKLTRDGTVDFSGDKITMDFMTESSVNYQLINAIQGGTKGGIEALLKGGVSGFQENVAAFLKGGLSEAQKVASTGDFRTVTLRIHGNADSLAFSGLKIGESTLKADTKNDAKPQPQKPTLREQITEKAKEVLPEEVKRTLNIKTDAKPATPVPVQAPSQPQKPQSTTRQKVEDRVKEELQKGIQRGLGELFKR